MSDSSVAGTSLVESLVALTLLELLAIGAMQATLQTRRIARHIAAGSAVDIARLEAVRHAAAAPSCRGAVVPTTHSVTLPASAQRPSMVVEVLCGR
jgi:Tfp pilus assembly protein FimT